MIARTLLSLGCLITALGFKAHGLEVPAMFFTFNAVMAIWSPVPKDYE